jgi:hypothetical protein
MMLALIFGILALAIGCVLVGWRLDKRSEMMRQRSFW